MSIGKKRAARMIELEGIKRKRKYCLMNKSCISSSLLFFQAWLFVLNDVYRGFCPGMQFIRSKQFR